MTENTINPITTLEFNGEEVEAKATFLFDKTAKKFAKDEQDENGKTTKVSGFNAIYNGILDEKQDSIELLQGALQVLNHSGFFKQKSRLFWTQMNSAPSMVKEEEKESTKNSIEFMKNNYKEIMGELPY